MTVATSFLSVVHKLIVYTELLGKQILREVHSTLTKPQMFIGIFKLVCGLIN